MHLSRLRFFSPKQSFNLLHRFGAARRVQFHSYKTSKGPRYDKADDPLVTVQTQPYRFPWTTFAFPVALFAGLTSLVYYNDQRRVAQHGIEGNKRRVDDKATGGPFTLIDTGNRVVTEQDFLGNWSLLYFGYTSSPDVGPEQVQVMAKAIDILERKKNCKVIPVFVTIDPQRDTPSHLHAYLKEFDSRIVGLTGPVNAVRQIAQEYRVFFRKVEEEGDDYLVESSHYMYLINPNLEVAGRFGTEYDAGKLSEEIFNEIEKHSS